MRRSVLLLALTLSAVSGCMTRTAPSARERGWQRELGAALPPGWKVLVVTGEPEKDRFLCWLEAPGEDARTRRVELTVTPHPNAPAGRRWVVKVHPPAGRPSRSVTFTAYDFGTESSKLAPEPGDDPEAVNSARPLAEEAVRQVRGLELF